MDRYCPSEYWHDFYGPIEEPTDEELEAKEQWEELKFDMWKESQI